MEVNERIKKKRKQLGLTMKQVADKLGVSESLISRYESKEVKNMGIDKLIPLAEVLGTTPAYLMGWQEEPSAPKIFPIEETYTNREKNHIKKYRSLKEESKDTIDKITDVFYTSEQLLGKNTDIIEENDIEYNTKEKVSTKSIPLYPKLAAAGTGQYLFDDIPSDTILVNAKQYKNASYAIGVSGDSMEPTFSDGDILIVDRETVPEIGEIGIFLIDGNSYVKRLSHHELISDNPKYPPIKSESGLCLGRVLGKFTN